MCLEPHLVLIAQYNHELIFSTHSSLYKIYMRQLLLSSPQRSNIYRPEYTNYLHAQQGEIKCLAAHG